MALSGSKNYSITTSDIIGSALRKIGIYDQGEAIDAGDYNAGAIALNLMVKALAAKDVGIWLNEEITLFLQPQTQSYLLGTTAEAAVSYVETTLSAAEALGQTVISVTSSTGMTAADRVGIKQDDDSIHWTTIVSVDSGTQITITVATTVAAASGKKVYTYTTRAGRPQKIKYAYHRDTSDNDTEVEPIGEIAYHSLSRKSSEGPPNQIWYKPSLTSGTLYVWPVDGGSSVDKLILLSRVLADDFDGTSNNPQFPIEWGETLVYMLGDRLAPEYNVSEKERRMLKVEAMAMLEDMLDYDVENSDVQFAMQ